MTTEKTLIGQQNINKKYMALFLKVFKMPKITLINQLTI